MARMQAGIQLKNHLYSKDYDIKCQYQQRWLTFPDEMRNFIKNNVSFLAVRCSISSQELLFPIIVLGSVVAVHTILPFFSGIVHTRVGASTKSGGPMCSLHSVC